MWACLLLSSSGSPSSGDEDGDLEENDSDKISLGEISNLSLLLADCDTVGENIDVSTEIQQDLQDILISHCVCMEREYLSVLCSILSPLLRSHNSFSKEMASTCFGTIASEFSPLLSMKAAAFEVAIDSVHSRYFFSQIIVIL